MSNRRRTFLKTWWSPYLGEWRPFHDNYIYASNSGCTFSGNSVYAAVPPTPTMTASPTETLTPTPTLTQTSTPSVTPTLTPTTTTTLTASPTQTSTPTVTPTTTTTLTASPTQTSTPTVTPTTTTTLTASPTSTITPTPSLTPNFCRQFTLSGNSQPFGTFFTWTNCDGTPGSIQLVGSTATICAINGTVSQSGQIGTITPEGVCTITPTPSPTVTQTRTPSVTSTPTVTATQTRTPQPTPTNTSTPSPTPLFSFFNICQSSALGVDTGTYNRVTNFSGTSASFGWLYHITNIEGYYVTGTAPDGFNYPVYQEITTGGNFNTWARAFSMGAVDFGWSSMEQIANPLVSGNGYSGGTVYYNYNTQTNGSIRLPIEGLQRFTGGTSTLRGDVVLSFATICPTPTLTLTPTPTPI